MPRFITTFLAVWIAFTGAAVADERMVVVELYTSQGCSSCPPADALLGELAERDDVLALALHVDYWDYIGWKDDMGDPAHTARQKDYARVAGKRMVYTPQMIIGGVDHVVGHEPVQVMDAIERHRAAPELVDLDVTREGDRMTVEASPVDGPAGRMVVQVARFVPEHTVKISRGENGGKTLTYHNSVVALREIGTWDGRGRFSVTLGVEGDLPVAVLLQRPGPGPILAAARAD